MDINDIKKGSIIMYQSEPFKIADYQHVKPGKGGAFARTKLKALTSDKTLDITFKGGDTIEGANVSTQDAQFLYQDEDNFAFMQMETYEQFSIPADIVGEQARFFQENMDVKLLLLDGNPIDVQIPTKLSFAVTESPPAVKGNTSTNANKEVTIETGAKIQVPLFIKEGETIIVNTDTGDYVSRG